MRSRFTVLGSGSSGNASLLEFQDFGVLLDLGLGPRQIAGRLTKIGASWKKVRAVLLTHTHSDHWRGQTFAHLLWERIPVFCHPEHVVHLRRNCDEFAELYAARLVRTYRPGEELRLAPGVRCRAFEVQHDGGPTFGFRVQSTGDLFSAGWSLAYAADLGTWDGAVVEQMSDADILALEFNHDVELQRASGRSRWLIDRVLGDEGHLSNLQAAELLREILKRSEPGRLRHVMQLHLSRECNRPALAAAAARTVLDHVAEEIEVHTACQDQPTTVELEVIRKGERQLG